jgi:predicted lipid-binding transport protein (Tim44 family)
MPRGGGRSSSSRSNSPTSRITAPKTTPPQSNQVAPQSRAGGLMGSMMSGMAFGAGAEFMRQLFRNPTTGGFMMPLLLSGGTAFAANKFLLQNSKNKQMLTFAVFGGSFLVFNQLFNRGGEQVDEYSH